MGWKRKRDHIFFLISSLLRSASSAFTFNSFYSSFPPSFASLLVSTTPEPPCITPGISASLRPTNWKTVILMPAGWAPLTALEELHLFSALSVGGKPEASAQWGGTPGWRRAQEAWSPFPETTHFKHNRTRLEWHLLLQLSNQHLELTMLSHPSTYSRENTKKCTSSHFDYYYC